jgi:amino acid transporter
MDNKSKNLDGVGVGDMHTEKQAELSPVISVREGQVEADVEKFGTLHRTLTPRLIHVGPHLKRGNF